MKLIIYVTGALILNGHARGGFLWSEKHQCYIWKGRELTPVEFNAEVGQAMTEHRKLLQPMVKILNPVDVTPITVDQAVAHLRKTAPGLLKAARVEEPEAAPV